MELTVGTIVEGKVKSITKFGAFISLADNQTGMVHISEITHAFVNDIREHLTEGQDVKAMVIATENGKINLSIRRTMPAPARPANDRPKPMGDRPPRPENRDNREFRPARPQQEYAPRPAAPRPRPAQQAPAQPQTFDDMLKQFMADSDSKMSGIKQYSERKTKTRRR